MALIVNSQRIDDAIVESEFSQIKSYFEHLGNVSCCERDPEFRGYARENVIARALLSQQAKRTLPRSTEQQVEEAVAKLVADYGGEVQFFAATGARPDQMDLVRHDVELELRTKAMIDQLCADISPTEAELREFYERNIQAFMTAEEVRASHILKSPKRGEGRSAAFEELRKLRTELQNGAVFETIAKTNSDKADEHIDLGFFKRGELAEEFETVAFSMEVDEISPVFLSPFGFHLIKLTDRKPSAARPFDEVRSEVEQQLRTDLRDKRTKALIEELKKSAVVEEVAEEVAV